MLVDNSAIDWAADNQRAPVDVVSEYTPQPIGAHESSGIHVIPDLERSLTSCGSGSRWYGTFARLREEMAHVNLGDDWSVIVLPYDSLAEQVNQLPSVAEKMAVIQDGFGLSVAALASILGASRASIYNWLENESPSASFTHRIDEIYKIASEWKSKNPYHFAPERLMRQKLSSGLSMNELLSRNELNMAEVHRAMKDLLLLMEKRRSSMDRAKARSAKSSSDSESRNELVERFVGSVTADT